MDTEKVSVITVCYNSAQTIKNAIRSVCQQTYPFIEYIVVDGDSKDGTLEQLSFYSDKITKFISEPDKGIYDAMNKGVELASGDLITFLNADDVFAHSGVVSNAVQLFKENQELGVVYGDVQFYDQDRLIRHYSSKNFQSWKLRFGWMPPHPGSFARKELYEEYGSFNLSYKISADYDMFVRWFLVGRVKYKRIDDVLVHMALGGVSTESLSARLTLNKEIVKACRNNGIYTNLFFLLFKIPFKLMELVVSK